MVLLETIPDPLGVRVDMLEMKTVRVPGSPGSTADMLEIVLGPPSTQEKVLKSEDCPRPSRHQIKHAGESLRTSRRHPGHAGDYSPPPGQVRI